MHCTLDFHACHAIPLQTDSVSNWHLSHVKNSIMTLKAYSIPCDDHITFSKKDLFLFFILLISSIFLSLICIIIIIIITRLFLFLRGGGDGGGYLWKAQKHWLVPCFIPLRLKRIILVFRAFLKSRRPGISSSYYECGPWLLSLKNRRKIEPKETPSCLIPSLLLLYLPGNLKS